MKFLADAMLGRISRFLRILGYDTFYPNDLDDSKILDIAKNESRIIITRDIELSLRAKSKKISYILLESVDFIENFSKIYKKFSIDLKLDPLKSRCPVCNEEISPIQKKKIRGRIPEKTYNHFEEFWICNNVKCNKIYYYGIHWEKMEQQLLSVKNFKP